MLSGACRVRVFDRRGRVEAARKRHENTPPSLLADLTDEALIALLAALRLCPDTEIMDWMSWPDLWFEFADGDGVQLVTLGLLGPGWVRWEPHGDLRLAAPESMTRWLSTWT
ncbi:hypothetical protein QLQ12_34010 [Actinoplanes sp. NEAU-A12]|uniref:Uncharacterized protein n=1 Tax=Actinoplanes sandaracinus TaxID=3045177 RepID=A0ABT6WVJ3_9ACTN|nr:hypothetical protein [Actinoplanes sandaracinus]